MSYQQSSNEGPYQQQPPVMSPRPSGSIDFQAMLKAQENRPLVIAGAGAILTLIGYLFFPIYSASGEGLTVSAKAGDLGGSSRVGTGLGGIYGFTWLVLIASIVGVVVVGLMLFAPKMVAQLTPRMGAMILTGCGAVCVLWTVLDFFKLNGLYSGSNKISGFSAGVDWGMYALIITSIVLLVGGIMQLRRSPAN